MNKKQLDSFYADSEIYLEEFLKMPKKVQQLLLLKGLNEIPSIFFHEINSPIEQIFITAFETYCKLLNKEEYFLFPQQSITINGKTYIVDFLFEFDQYVNPFKIERPLIIECDGYEFHNANKEQVAKDNERDYALKMAGYDVIRFSGSQIYRNPLKCAEDTYKYIKSLIKEE